MVSRGPGSSLLAIPAVLAIAIVLRPGLTGVGPLLPEIMAGTGLGATGASLLTTLPVLFLGLAGPAAPLLGQRLGLERAVLAALAAIAVGLLVRGAGQAVPLFAGSLLAGAGIGVGNVLMPAVVKRDFARRAALMTGLYTGGLCLGAALASAAAVPLAQYAGGWRASLAFWTLPTLLALALGAAAWRGGAPRRPASARAARAGLGFAGLLRSGLAWQVTLFMGLQSLLSYAVFGWLAPILRSRGDDARTAGLVVGVSIFAQLAASLPAPALAAALPDQRALNALSITLIVASLFGLIEAPLAWQWTFAVTLGLGAGGAFALAIMLMVLRTGSAEMAASLSGMAQSIGYTIAASGPLLVGMLHASTGNWHGAEAVFVVAGVVAAISGALAGQPRLLVTPLQATVEERKSPSRAPADAG